MNSSNRLIYRCKTFHEKAISVTKTFYLSSKEMKKLLTFIIAIFYLASSTGATVRLHYCMGKLANWGVGYDQSRLCTKCGMSESLDIAGCCNDEHTYIKNHSDQEIAYPSISLFKALIIPGLPELPEISLPVFSSMRKGHLWKDHPPLWRTVKVYLFKRSFLI